MAEQKQIGVVIEAFDLIKTISAKQGSTALELQNSLGLSRDKTFRLLATLREVEIVEECGGGVYGLGKTMAKLWAAYRSNLDREIDQRIKDKLETEVRGG